MYTCLCENIVEDLNELYILIAQDATEDPSLNSQHWTQVAYQSEANSSSGFNQDFDPPLSTRNLAIYSTNFEALAIEELFIFCDQRGMFFYPILCYKPFMFSFFSL